MILSAEEFGQLMREITKSEWFKEWLDNYIKEIIDAKVCEAIEQHEEDYEHKEKMLTVEEVEKE